MTNEQHAHHLLDIAETFRTFKGQGYTHLNAVGVTHDRIAALHAGAAALRAPQVAAPAPVAPPAQPECKVREQLEWYRSLPYADRGDLVLAEEAILAVLAASQREAFTAGYHALEESSSEAFAAWLTRQAGQP